MIRLFSDMYISPKDRDSLIRILTLEKKLGYENVGIDPDLLKSIGPVSEKIREKIKIFPIKIIEAKEEGLARKKIKKIDRKDLILIGRTTTPAVFRFFSKDSRIRIIEAFPKIIKFLDKNEAELLKIGESVIGVNLSRLVEKPANLSWFSQVVKKSHYFGIPLVLYSGATTWNQLWHPRVLYSIYENIGLDGKLAYSDLSPPFLR